MRQKSKLHLFGEGIELIITDTNSQDLISQSLLNVQMFIRETLASYN